MASPTTSDLDGRVVALTGGTSGIGRRAALDLADRGATVAAVGRNETAGETIAVEVADCAGDVRFHCADLAAQATVRELAADLRATYDRLDVLAHNAGLSTGSRTESPDGIELTFAVNHLAPYLLTHELADRLRADGGGRVVVTASGLHTRADLDFDDLQFENGFDTLAAYSRSKLANVAFTIELADRFAGLSAASGGGDGRAGGDGSDAGDGTADDGDALAVTANCFHPGFVPGTGLWRDTAFHVRAAIRAAAVLPGIGSSETTGGERLVQLVADPAFDDRTGCYVSGGSVTDPSADARDPETRRRLWERSAELVGVDPDWPTA